MKTSSWDRIIGKFPSDFEMKRGLTSFVNPYSMLLLKKQDEIADRVNFWYADGIVLVKLINGTQKKKIAGRSETAPFPIKRYSFDDTSVAPVVFRFAKENHLKAAIIGTKEEYIDTAVSNIEEKYGMTVTYRRNGYFHSEAERAECYRQIMTHEIDIVVCGMGTPHQENFLIGLEDCGWKGYGFTCGGFLHQTMKRAVGRSTGSSDYYPPFFNKWNLRWLYRMIDEPKLVSRYFFLYPLFLLHFFIHRMRKRG